MPLNEEDVREILRLIDESDVEELRVETEDLSLYVLRGEATASRAIEDAHAAAKSTTDSAAGDGPQPIVAPMLGIFYRAEAPGAAPFVEVGARVEPNTIVCLIEVMKMMNAVPAGAAGTIVEVCAENAELVDAGKPLFRLRPES